MALVQSQFLKIVQLCAHRVHMYKVQTYIYVLMENGNRIRSKQ